MLNKIIFHIDFDCYFVSAHRSLNPKLLNKPIAIAKNEGKAISCAVSYELRELGIKNGDPAFMIKKICPRTIFINANYLLYINLSNLIFDYITKNYSNKFEMFSIDECWLDMSQKLEQKTNDQILDYAKRIQMDILKKFKIPISIGISHNKFLSKMATNLAKPFGIKLIDEDNLQLIWDLEINKFFGIGKSLTNKLNNFGIKKIGEIAKLKENSIEAISCFGKFAKKIIDTANGQYDEPLNEGAEMKSLGSEITFDFDNLDNENDFYLVLNDLANKVCQRAKSRGQFANTVVLRIRNISGKWISRQKKLNSFTNDVNVVAKTSIKLFNDLNRKNIKGIGVALSNLIFESNLGTQISLFESNNEQLNENNKIDKIIKDINLTMNKDIAKTGIDFLKEQKIKDKTHNNVKFINIDEKGEKKWK
ncbi:Y-family DNA polymerase [Mycoplasmopsis hyopharyngis]|uniref:Y-family DNA polymerase n=1 Tax=Mycoplasmopsis hyopharyngis TaxID=29558 RepID=UPI0038739F64